jgi:transcriptional regulator GlxA family with amidase domain
VNLSSHVPYYPKPGKDPQTSSRQNSHRQRTKVSAMRFSKVALLGAILPCTLGSPSQPHITNTTKLPTHFGAIIFNHFQAIDLIGPLDIFNSMAMLYANETKMRLTLLAKTLNPVSTGMGPGTFGESFLPTMTFEDYLSRKNAKGDDQVSSSSSQLPQYYDDGAGGHAVAKRALRFEGRQSHGTDDMNMPGMPTMSDDPGDIEVLIVPGGGGTRANMTAEIAFVRDIYPKLQYIISVCTGATILARAGVLDNRRATTNKRSWPWAVTTGPNTTWVPTARWVEDGNIWSSSGISAGIDVAYAWVSAVYGDPVSEYMSKSLEYDRHTDSHHDPYGKIWDVPVSSPNCADGM